MVDHWHVSTPARAGRHPSSWYRFEGSGLPVHHFEVWRRDQTDPVFVCGRCMRRRTSSTTQNLVVGHQIDTGVNNYEFIMFNSTVFLPLSLTMSHLLPVFRTLLHCASGQKYTNISIAKQHGLLV